jgi:phospholipase C
MRMEGTPHTWPDAQAAWDNGRMALARGQDPARHGLLPQADIPFQWRDGRRLHLCDAYHCSMQTGTNTNRLFLWTGTTIRWARAAARRSTIRTTICQARCRRSPRFFWTTYPERLEAAGVNWRVYQDMADNFTDNPLANFLRIARRIAARGDPALKDRALSTHALDALRADVLADRLPQMSWVVATAEGSEHPGPSSPAQGAAYTAELIEALTANPAVWARTALFINFDENDGFFDHVPPPAPPSPGADGRALCGSHRRPDGRISQPAAPATRGRRSQPARAPYGLGPRVPMYVVSPWSRGGWVNSQVFDHTSVIRFLETRFGFREPNISPWRRAICGDLTGAFDFSAKDDAAPSLPDPRGEAIHAAAIKGQVSPQAPMTPGMPHQEPGLRRARPLPYRLEVQELAGVDGLGLRFQAEGAGAVFHVYDRLALDRVPAAIRSTPAPGSRTLEPRCRGTLRFVDPGTGRVPPASGGTGARCHSRCNGRSPRTCCT